MQIAVGCDHRGLSLKQFIIQRLTEAGYSYQDFGGYTTEPVDYPDVAREVAEAVAGGNYERGILICQTGIGMSIAANKITGARAALCRNADDAYWTRRHNDANILCLGAGGGPDTVAETVAAFIAGEFEGGRHQQRVDKITALEGRL